MVKVVHMSFKYVTLASKAAASSVSKSDVSQRSSSSSVLLPNMARNDVSLAANPLLAWRKGVRGLAGGQGDILSV